MNDYYEVNFTVNPPAEDVCDLLADALGEIGYESFVSDSYDGSSLTAYVKKELYSAVAVDEAVGSLLIPAKVEYSAKLIEGQDWNAEWEKNYFQPIVIGEKCVIHSTFHTDVPTAEYDIVIDPKMAFGTGHHSTTSLMVQGILRLMLEGMKVVDMGTGTAILAILAAMRGANVYAVEIDEFAYVNAVENVRLNGCADRVDVRHGDAALLDDYTGMYGKADFFLANINRNIITNDLARYVSVLHPGAIMLLSGFYESDVPVVANVAEGLGLKVLGYEVADDNWACLRLKYEPEL